MNPEATAGTRYSTTSAGRIRAGRRRLAALLWGLAGAALAAAVYAWLGDRTVPALLAFGLAALALFAWRISGDLEPVAVWLDRDRLLVQTRRHLVRRNVAGASARRLDSNETDHLRRLVSTGIFVTASGGFDSRLLGELDLYASNLDNLVLIDLGEERIVVTPDDPERFLAGLNDRRRA